MRCDLVSTEHEGSHDNLVGIYHFLPGQRDGIVRGSLGLSERIVIKGEGLCYHSKKDTGTKGTFRLSMQSHLFPAVLRTNTPTLAGDLGPPTELPVKRHIGKATSRLQGGIWYVGQ